MNLQSIIETILFVHGEPLSLEKLAKAAKANKEETKQALTALNDTYSERGIILLEKDGLFQIGSNPENTSYVEDLIKGEFTEELSKAALETLSVIAYKGPLTRVDIEYVRGVNSSFTLRNLMMRGIIERIDNPRDARSYLYRVSFDFLKHFGVASVEELPNFAEFKATPVELPTQDIAEKTKSEMEPISDSAGEENNYEDNNDGVEDNSTDDEGGDEDESK